MAGRLGGLWRVSVVPPMKGAVVLYGGDGCAFSQHCHTAYAAVPVSCTVCM